MDWIKLWWTSPKAFLRSSRVITTERCLMRALLIISAISCAVCSRVPDRLGVKPFCMFCSMKLLDMRKQYMAFQRHDVNTFKGTD